MQQHEVEHVERVDRAYAFDQRALAVTVQRLQREAAGVDLAAFGHELRDLVIEVLMPRERGIPERREAALHAQRDARPVEQHRGLESLALQTRRLQQVDEADRTFERDGVEGDERLLAG